MSGITVGVDGSGNAQPALDWAMNEAVVRKLPLTVLTVHEVIASYFVPGRPVVFPGDEELLAKARQATEEAVTDAARRLDTGQPQVTVTAVSGFAAQTLIEASREADLLVVGTRGGGGFPHLSLGGVASQVVHHAHCPVVVVRHGG
jgi:nucleotide-binding universal stress UspA family protein